MSAWTEIANPWVKDLPVYEPGRPVEEVARELGFEDPSELVKVASNENALGPSPRAVAAMQDVAGAMHRYPDGGAFYLKRAMADRLGVAPDMLLFGNGSNELLEFLGHAFLAPDTNVVVAECAFVVYRLVAAAARAGVVSVPMRELTHDLSAMADAITPETRIVFVSNPNNPTGTMVGQEEIDRFMDSVPKHVLVCFDEAYIELLPPDRTVDTLRYVRDGRLVTVLRTFSKAYGLAGLRIGYGVAPSECIQLLNRVRQPFNVNAMAQAAALAALDDEDHVRRTVNAVQEGIGYLSGEWRRLGIEFVPTVANFMLVKVGKGREAFQALQKEGVIVRPMDGYGLPDHVRITIGTHEENLRVVQAVERLRGSPE